jgi:plasmid stabilization system protein ParE
VKPRTFHRDAEQEYGEAVDYYLRIDPELGGRFYDEMESLICDIRRQPDRFRMFDPPVRRHFSNVFPYAILYVDQPDRVLIIAVMHMKRQPGYWHERLI